MHIFHVEKRREEKRREEKRKEKRREEKRRDFCFRLNLFVVAFTLNCYFPTLDSYR
jgi:hypothetical protein